MKAIDGEPVKHSSKVFDQQGHFETAYRMSSWQQSSKGWGKGQVQPFQNLEKSLAKGDLIRHKKQIRLTNKRISSSAILDTKCQ